MIIELSSEKFSINYGLNAVYISFGEALDYIKKYPGNYNLIDVPGVGAQRSNTKTGDSNGFGTGIDYLSLKDNYKITVSDYTIPFINEFYKRHGVKAIHVDAKILKLMINLIVYFPIKFFMFLMMNS